MTRAASHVSRVPWWEDVGLAHGARDEVKIVVAREARGVGGRQATARPDLKLVDAMGPEDGAGVREEIAPHRGDEVATAASLMPSARGDPRLKPPRRTRCRLAI